jgi:hypothetical protein
MAAAFVEVRIAGHSFRSRALEERAPGAAEVFRAQLPLTAMLRLDEWSGSLGRISSRIPVAAFDEDERVPFAYPGLVMVDARTGELAMCYGQGRLQDGLGPIAAVPLLEIGGDLTALIRAGERLQYDGSVAIEFAVAADQDSPLAEPLRQSERTIKIDLGEVTALADVLERTSPITTTSLVAQLPITGTATHTFISGPMVRIRQQELSRDELVLDTREEEITHSILYPGIVYYRPVFPRGLRIATRDATTMGGGVVGVGTRLVPLARLMGDWAAFRHQAHRLLEHGQQPVRLSLLEPD